jgi:hypothetical protein
MEALKPGDKVEIKTRLGNEDKSYQVRLTESQ